MTWVESSPNRQWERWAPALLLCLKDPCSDEGLERDGRVGVVLPLHEVFLEPGLPRPAVSELERLGGGIR